MPTLKQTIAAKKTLENIGNPKKMTMGEILLGSGYSPAIAKNPQMVTETAGYKESLQEMLRRKGIDKQSRLERLAEIFNDKDKRSAIAANKEISLMLGDYSPIKQEISDLREERNEIFKPE